MCQICQTISATENKHIHRTDNSLDALFNHRELESDYKTLLTALRPGLRVLDIGCARGSVSKDIAQIVGPTGQVIAIDKTQAFINQAKQDYSEVENLEFIESDLFEFQSTEKFDLIVSARTWSWISTLDKAIDKLKSLLKPSGQVSILDFNHEAINWQPAIPKSMQHFYNMFLMWRKDAGMNNRLAFDLADILEEHGFRDIEIFNADEHYQKPEAEQQQSLKLWSRVAACKQMVEEGYISEQQQQQAIAEYNHWAEHQAESMTLKLREVRAILN